jgi:hypothetical protein
VGNTYRRLSFFVIVLSYSRQMYVEFTVSQTMEHFLACHEHAFAAFNGVPCKIMVDNLKSAVLQRLAGVASVLNPRYLDFARHYGFTIAPCNVARGNEKGRVESGVGYVKKNFLRGLELTEFSAIQAAAQVWLDTIANVRIHRETHQRPVDMLQEERPHLTRLNPHPYDIAHTATTIASSQFRITLDTNTYSVPSHYAHRRLTLKAYPDRLCIYFDGQLIARHKRSYDRHQDIEDPEHAKADRQAQPRPGATPDAALLGVVAGCASLLRRPRAKEVQRPTARPQDPGSGRDLSGRCRSARHLRWPRLPSLQRRVHRQHPGDPGPHTARAWPLQLTRAHDLLDIDIPPPDLNVYDGGDNEPE